MISFFKFEKRKRSNEFTDPDDDSSSTTYMDSDIYV